MKFRIEVLDLLVPVSLVPHSTYTSGLLPGRLPGVLTARAVGYLISGRVSRLDAFSVYPIQT